jgi:PPK2 family polyphosphate:nucleotide phosphotransferase
MRAPKRRLDSIRTTPPAGTSRERVSRLMDGLEEELSELEDLLYYARTHGVLIVLQGRDTSGKDGTIRKLLDHCNALGVRVQAFKVPTDQERAHDFLWRVHAVVPARGEIVLFNRSHYEDVLVPRVHSLVARGTLTARYRAINDFERLLVANGTIVFKFFLHISRDEQQRRLLSREQEREKAWKLAVGDWREREHWDAYTSAYEVAMAKCDRPAAPWHVVPADAKWYRNYVIIRTVVEGLRPYRAGWLETLAALGETRRRELDAYRTATAAVRQSALRADPARGR